MNGVVPPYRSHRVRLGLVALVLGTLIFAGCAQSNTPTQYDAVTESNFDDGCSSAGGSSGYCSCAYRVLSGPGGVPYSEFAKIDDQLASKPDSLPDEVKALLQPCSDPSGPTTTAVTGTGGA